MNKLYEIWLGGFEEVSKTMSIDPQTNIKQILQNVDERGYLKQRESSTIEFKESFNFGNMPKYSKTMAAFANNKGGYILFGIKDSPRELIGTDKDKDKNLTI